jgi:Tol biopolymer transport system component
MRRLRLPAALLLTIAPLAACAGTDASPSVTASVPTSPPASAATPSAAASEEPASEPEPAVLAADVISSDAEEYRISFTPDGTTAYFARGDAFFPQSRRATILESRLVDGVWTEPEVASFSGEHPDIDPWVAPDGSYLLFSSIRPVGGDDRSDAELFRVDRDGDTWSEPVHLSSLGSASDELGASVAADGTIVFASDRLGGAGGWDLYTAAAEGDGWGEPEPLAALNTAIWEFNPAIDPAADRLVFTSINRDGGSGLGDLFVSDADSGTWSEARPLALNTAADEYHPSLAPDGRTLYFVRRQGDGDLYEVPWAEVAPPG